MRVPSDTSLKNTDSQLEKLFAERLRTIRREIPEISGTEPGEKEQALLAACTERFRETVRTLGEEYAAGLSGGAGAGYSGFGVLGKDLNDSCLPALHGIFADYEYRLFPVPGEQLEAFLRRADFRGVNVEGDYRETVLPFLDELSPRAQETRHVNLIVKTPDGKLVGHNTDYDGFADMMRYEGVNFGDKSVMILGDGSMSRTLAAFAREHGAASVCTVGSAGTVNSEQAYEMRDTQIIINTTGIGGNRDSRSLPIDVSAFMALQTVIDTVYQPLRTRLCAEAERLGIHAVGGLYMLTAQTRRSAEMLSGTPVERARTADAYAKMTRRLQNIVLIGMPGCGKSSIGKRLARLLGMRHLDTDELIAQRTGKSAEEIFNESGEREFRRLEAEVVAEISAETGCVISTGGGTVIDPENVDLLRQNGRMIWIDRAVSELALAGRPLSRDPEAVRQLYAQRRPIYRNAADTVIRNRTNAQIAAKEIARLVTGRVR